MTSVTAGDDNRPNGLSIVYVIVRKICVIPHGISAEVRRKYRNQKLAKCAIACISS